MNKIMIQNIHATTQKITSKKVVQNKSFAQLLDHVVNKDVKFSKHAIERLASRNIKLDNKEIFKIKEALNKANQKGIKETLILMNNKAFVASVQNKTIITVATDEQLKDNVFTNIDGAVII
ncbi:TIGR02530 family flagellar biosynthesis protein [Marinisporobacter balticus]|uniref:Flagellar operon protein n=1 Tax=Marinisporobacter balticus TaxID=2018667 RepID=A0A4R2L0L5_9FIRM|nr:TIGR02530 family flagellar biosynthesis protein [Marinisporobacter balticus]TCO79944.1 flagellar operon protein [Marinisporobacter balticus]